MSLFECNSCGIISIILLSIIGILGFHYIYFLWNADYWKKKGVFSPNPRALLGNLPGQLTGKKHIIYDMDDLYKKYEKQHPYIGIFQLRQPRLLVFDPEVIKLILINNFKNFQGTEFYDRTSSEDLLFGEHSFFLIGEKWKTKRQEISPSFTNNRIKAIYPTFQDVLKKMNEFIKNEIEKPNHDGFDAKDVSKY
jgi:cytochrome P450 family 28